MSMAATTTQTPHASVSAFLNVRLQLERDANSNADYETYAASLLARNSLKDRNADSQNTESTKTEYRNSFDTLARTVGPYKLWNVVNEVSNTFNKDLHPQLRSYLNEKRSSIRPPRHYRGPKEPRNALRCYMVGMTQDRASPHVAILCKEKWFRTQARLIILESGFLQDRGWVGCIKLPCEISQNGATSPSPKRAEEVRRHPSSRPDQHQHNVAISYIPEGTKTLCGLRIAISGIDGYVRMATLGGIIKLDEALFGLSVSHAFSTPPQIYDGTDSECQSDTDLLILDQDDLDPFVRATASDELSDDLKQNPDTSDPSEPSAKNTEVIGAEDNSTPPSVDTDVVDLPKDQHVDSDMTQWSLGSRETFGNEAAYEFEWALIASSIVHDRLANATTTSLGETLSITSLASEKAPAGTRLLLTTPRGGITAIAISSESGVQLTPGKEYLSLWTVRLDRVEDGDCGSWVIDEVTGELFGMLVAACEAVNEAYILPINDIFMDIAKLSGHSVKLPTAEPDIGKNESSSEWEDESLEESDSPALTPTIRGTKVTAASLKGSNEVEDVFARRLEDSHPLYTPLEPDSIRIVNLLPGKREASVQCEFSVCDFNNQADYEILSYYSGGPERTSSIHVNGRMINVNLDLASALKDLRYSNTTRPLWVDALSINQEDVEEKNSQVSRMASITTRASNACIWLGEENKEHSWAFSCYDSIIDLHNFAYPEDIDSKVRMRLVSAFASLAERDWSRLEFQIVCLASSSTIHCGRASMPWKYFADAITLFTTYRPFKARKSRRSSSEWVDEDDMENLNMLSYIVRDVDGLAQRSDDGLIERKYSLESLVMDFPYGEPKTPHDIVYSRLSLARDVSPSSKPLITWTANTTITPTVLKAAEAFLRPLERPLERRIMVVDYSQPFENVCQDFVHLAIQNSQSLDILCTPWAPNVDKLPSWVPDRTTAAKMLDQDQAPRRLTGTPFVNRENDGHHRFYNASRLKRPNFRMSNRSVDALTISVEGFILDVVQEKQNPALMGNVPPGWTDFLGWKNSKGPPPDKAWRTLVADRGPDSDEAPPRFYSRACELVFQQNESKYGVDMRIEIERIDTITSDFCRRVEKVIWGRRLIRTERHGFVGLAPGATKKRDIVAILYGLSVPVVLRQVQDAAQGDNLFTIVGECFIYGMMDGEALDFRKVQRIPKQTFVLR